MARKDTLVNYQMFGTSGCDMSATTTSSVTNVNLMDNLGIILNWTGASSPVGVVTFEVSNDYNANTGNAGTWQALNFGSTISISGSSGTHDVSINQLPYSNIRAKYTRTSGSGTLNCYLTVKQIGG